MNKLRAICDWNNYKKAYRYLQKNGWKNVWYAARERMAENCQTSYEMISMNREQWEKQREQAEILGRTLHVKFSILVPLYETKKEYLKELLDSVCSQTYREWELILADASETEQVRERVKEYVRDRTEGWEAIRYIRLEENRGISENSNAALAYATGNYTGLLDHDDTLSPDALYEMAAAIREKQKQGISAKMLYSDEDKMDGAAVSYYEPNFKEDFNLDLLLSNNYICHFLVLETELMKELQFQSLYDGAQDYDLILRASSKCRGNGEIVHIPKILYHWRCHENSTAVNPRSKMYAYEAGRKAVADYCKAQGWKIRIRHSRHLGFYEVEYLHGLFQTRRDIGAVGGRILSRGQVVGGACREDGTVMYEHLNSHFSGYMHRAAIQQDVDAVDIRCMKIREELHPVLQEAVTDVLGRANLNMDQLRSEATQEEIVKISLLFSRKVREQGYLILYNPRMEETIEK